jgi:hypothetical protein
MLVNGNRIAVSHPLTPKVGATRNGRVNLDFHQDELK